MLDGYSRFIVSWGLRQSMTDQDVQIVIQRGLEAFPGVEPRIISDCGAQFASKDFCQFIRLLGLIHTTTSPYYPQSNGKLERANKTIKEYLETMHLESYADGIRLIEAFIDYYNHVRLHSAVGYVAPVDRLAGRDSEIQAARKLGLVAAAERRKENLRESA